MSKNTSVSFFKPRKTKYRQIKSCKKTQRRNQDLAGGGNLPQERGATARGRRGGIKTKAGGSNLPQDRGANARGRRGRTCRTVNTTKDEDIKIRGSNPTIGVRGNNALLSLVPKTPITKTEKINKREKFVNFLNILFS